MLNIYLDTNVYIIGLLQPNTNSARILMEIAEGEIKVLHRKGLKTEGGI